MISDNISHTPFKQLPPQAVALFFLQAMGAWGLFHTCPPTMNELESTLETVWDENHLTPLDLRDFHRMKNLIANHLSPSTTAVS